MDLELNGRSAIVTGGSRGIGKAVARVLAGDGCNVVITGRYADTLSIVSGRDRHRNRRSGNAHRGGHDQYRAGQRNGCHRRR